MALEFVLKYEGLDPAKVGVFVDSNAFYLARPEEIRRFRYHATREAIKEGERLTRGIDLNGLANRFVRAFEQVGSSMLEEGIIDGSLCGKAVMAYHSKRATDEFSKNGLIVKGRKPDNSLTGAGQLNAKRIAAEAISRYLPSWEPTSDPSWRDQQVGVALESAYRRYAERLALLGLAGEPGYRFTLEARKAHIRRRIHSAFAEFSKNPEAVGHKAQKSSEENLVDVQLLATACDFDPRAIDHKETGKTIIVTGDIDLVEMVADLAFIHPAKIRDLGIVTTKVFSKE